MNETLSTAEKARLARTLRGLLRPQPQGEDELLSNAAAAEYLGGMSTKTLSRLAYPNDPNGPVPIRFTETGNLYWSKRELDGYIVRKRIRTETNLMDGLEKRSLLTDITDF